MWFEIIPIHSADVISLDKPNKTIARTTKTSDPLQALLLAN